MFSLKVINKNERTVAWARGEEEVNLMVAREYEEGDRILLEVSGEKEYAWVQLDDAFGKSLVSVSYTHLDVYKRQDLPYGKNCF